MSFTVCGTQVRIRFAAAAVLAFCFVIGEWERTAAAVLSLALHEAAHFIAAGNVGATVSSVCIYPFGAVMHVTGWMHGSREEAVCSLAGPMGSLAFAAMLRVAEGIFPDLAFLGILFRTNLMIALVNLLPAFPLDGGRVFWALLLRAAKRQTATRILFAITLLLALCTEALGVFLLTRGFPAWTAILLPPFLVLSAKKELLSPVSAVWQVAERRSAIRAGAAGKVVSIAVSDALSVGEALALLSGRHYTVLRVLRKTGTAELDEGVLLDAAAKFGCETPLKTVISRLTSTK